MVENCSECNNCVQECKFLQKYGNPRQVAEKLKKNPLIAYECSVCRLCEEICNQGVKFTDLILIKRVEAVENRIIPEKKFRLLLNLEKYLTSNFLKTTKIPKNAKKLFYVGCSFSGKSPDFIMKTYQNLEKEVGEPVGITLECCYAVSYLIGYHKRFKKKTEEQIEFFKKSGIEEIITVCPGCSYLLRKFFPFNVSLIYQYLKIEKKHNFDFTKVHIHDPCSLREDNFTHNKIREIVKNLGLEVISMEHEREKTFCCGEGGGTFLIDKAYSDAWKKKRFDETEYPLVVYCYGCKTSFYKKENVYHILDLIFNNSKFPHMLTPRFWINRFLLKRKINRRVV